MIDGTDRITLQVVVLGCIQIATTAFVIVWLVYGLYTHLTYSTLIKVR